MRDRLCADLIDFQNCPVQGIRPEMYNSRDRKCRRTAASVQKRLNEEMRSLCIRTCDADDCSPSSSTGGWLRKTLSLGNFPLSLLSYYSSFSQHWAAFGISSCLILIAYSFVPFYCNFHHCLLPGRGNTEPACWTLEFGFDSFPGLSLIQLNRCSSTGPIYISKCQVF